VKAKVNVGGVVLPWYFGVSLGGASAVVEEGDKVTWKWHDGAESQYPQGVGGSEGFFTGRGGTGTSVTEYGFTYSKVFNEAGKYCFRLRPARGPSVRQGSSLLLLRGPWPPLRPRASRGSASYGTPYSAQGEGGTVLCSPVRSWSS